VVVGSGRGTQVPENEMRLKYVDFGAFRYIESLEMTECLGGTQKFVIHFVHSVFHCLTT